MDTASVLIALSGGVDSSIAAYLIVQAGHTCAGATMRLFDSESVDKDASAICARLGITHHVFDFTDTFAQQVIDRFVAAYERGWTPNPCIDCNRYLKFERLFNQAQELGYEQVATGHYAQREYDTNTGCCLLKRGIDRNKDQSYVLYMLTQDQLAHTLFPLGELTKEQTRKIARQQGFSVADKSESQDICFIPNHDYGAFIRHHTGRCYEPGDILNTQSKPIGRHRGTIDFTIGQRKGLGIAAAHPLYVTEIIPQTAIVVAGEESDLYSQTAIIDNINLIACESLEQPLRATAKHRYRSKEEPATVTQIDKGKLKVTFDHPQKAITCGQALVIYDNDIVIGGGTITEAQ